MVLAAIGDARDAADAAETSKQSAARSAELADGSAVNSAASATLAESYAKGGTSTRTGEDADNALYYKGQAASSAQNAATSEEHSLQYKNACQAAHDEIFDILNNATILDTTETVTLNADNLVQQIVHTSNETGLVVRTDVFTYDGDVVTEVRTAADGRTQTNIYNLETLEQQFNV